ncbi:MAG: hypothetical protein MZU97_10355 [Bacillus subtilis]|nr:hypothetical protein [Bacillus subtilis]
MTIIIPSYNEEKNVRPFYDETAPYLNRSRIMRTRLLYVNDGSQDDTLAGNQEARQGRPAASSICRSPATSARRRRCTPASKRPKTRTASSSSTATSSSRRALIPEDDRTLPRKATRSSTRKGATRKGEPKMRTLLRQSLLPHLQQIHRHAARQRREGLPTARQGRRQGLSSDLGDKYRFVKGIFSWVGYKRKCLEYDFIPRRYGKSTWSFKSLFRYGFNGMNQFSQIVMILAAPRLSRRDPVARRRDAVALSLSMSSRSESSCLSLQGNVVLLVADRAVPTVCTI